MILWICKVKKAKTYFFNYPQYKWLPARNPSAVDEIDRPNVHLSPDRCYLAPIFSNISPLFLDTGNNFSLRYCDSVPNNHQGNWRNRLLAGEMSRHARQDTTQPWFDVYLTILPHFHRGQSLNLVFLSSLRPYLASFGKFYVGDNF